MYERGLCPQESSSPDGGGAARARGQDEEDGTRNGTSVWDEGQREAAEAPRLRGWGKLSRQIPVLICVPEHSQLTSACICVTLQLQRRHEQMKKNLEAQHKELEEKRHQFEEEKNNWETQQKILEQQKLDASR